jgi:hypothetical protein
MPETFKRGKLLSKNKNAANGGVTKFHEMTEHEKNLHFVK